MMPPGYSLNKVIDSQDVYVEKVQKYNSPQSNNLFIQDCRIHLGRKSKNILDLSSLCPHGTELL